MKLRFAALCFGALASLSACSRTPITQGDSVAAHAAPAANPPAASVAAPASPSAEAGPPAPGPAAAGRAALAGTPRALATHQRGPGDLTVDATSVYWANYHGDTVMKVAIAGGAPADGDVEPDHVRRRRRFRPLAR